MDSAGSSSREALGKYIPAVILERFAREHAEVSEPVSDPVRCALLFADIKGFTALTERLTAMGPAGVEALTGIINAYFGPLVDALMDHGGDIVKFAGDALITIWAVDDEEGLPDATLRCANAALAAQAAVADYTTPSGEPLGLKIAISSGVLHGAHLGGERGRWEFVLSGAPLSSVGLAAEQCDAGEVVLQSSAAQLVAEQCDLDMRDLGVALLRGIHTPPPTRTLVQPTVDAELEDALWTYVPGAIRSRVRAGLDSMLGELRRITVVFATLPGHDRGLPLAQSQALVLALQRTLYRHEGSLNKLSVDDKGVSLLAALGLPPFAHDDDPSRGLRVGLEMQATFAAHGLRSRIGVATGRAFCGLVGSPRRCEYTMMGDVVNLAARLMVAATDGLLCDHPTQASADEQFDFAALEPLSLKGKSQPVPVFAPLRERAAVPMSRTHAMVGRDAERAELEVLLRALRGGHSGVVVIEGEAGVGKSRLLHEVQTLAGDDITVLPGAADAVERTTPYQAWRGVFARLCQLDGINDPGERRVRALQALGDDPRTQQLGPLLNALALVELPDNDFTRDLTGEARADNTHDLAIAMLRTRAAHGPLAITIEDTHWMDSASWTLLRRAAREVDPLALVLATRPVAHVQQTAEQRELLGLSNCTHLVLEALAPEQAITLVCHRLGVATLPEAARSVIVEKAGGNPFFSEELAKGMLEAGLIEIHAGECRIADGVDLREAALPETVQGAVTQRIDRLAPTPQLVLKVASVIGRVFTMSMLRDVFPLAEGRAELAQHLEELLGLDVTELEAPSPNLTYIFKHIITQEVAYELMLFSQRRGLHRATAEWLEREHTSDLTGYLPLLAHHWKQAEEPARAMHYFELAGEAALRTHASGEAVEFFGEALRLGADAASPAPGQQLARWQRRLGDAYYALGDLSRAGTHLRESLKLFGYPFPASLPRLLSQQLGMALVQCVHRVATDLMTGRKAAQRELLLEVAQADERLTQLHYMRNDSIGTLYGGLRALNLAESVGPSAELARTAANMSVIACICLLPRLAPVYERLALESVASIADPAVESYVLEVTGIYHIGCAHWPLALQRVDRAIEIAERFAEHRRYEECAFGRGAIRLRTGHLQQAGQQFDALLASGQRREAPQVLLWALGGRVAVDSLGEQDAARVEALRAALIAHGNDSSVLRADRVWAYGSMAAGSLRIGDETAALAAARAVVDNTSVLQMTAHYLLEGFDGAASTLLALWSRHPDRAGEYRAHARLLCTALRNLGFTYPCARPQALLRRAELLWLEGKRARALRAWQRCVAVAQRVSMPGVEMRAHDQLAQHLDTAAAEPHRRAGERLRAQLHADPPKP